MNAPITSEFSDDYYAAIFRSLDDGEDTAEAPPDLDDLSEDDLSWLGPIEPARKDPLLVALRAAMDEFQSSRPNVFLRSINVEDEKYIVVGTWMGAREDTVIRINAAPGKFKSLVAALDDLVVKDLREEGPDGEHRVWLLAHRPGMPLKLWVSKDGRNVGVLHYVLTDDGWRKIDSAEYARTRGAWS